MEINWIEKAVSFKEKNNFEIFKKERGYSYEHFIISHKSTSIRIYTNDDGFNMNELDFFNIHAIDNGYECTGIFYCKNERKVYIQYDN